MVHKIHGLVRISTFVITIFGVVQHTLTISKVNFVL